MFSVLYILKSGELNRQFGGTTNTSNSTTWHRRR